MQDRAAAPLMTSRILVAIVRLYQTLVSPLLSRWVRCRFYPTCSEYAAEVLTKYGVKRGLALAYRRLLRCRPDNLDSCIDLP